jgi:hypothetical protein
MADLYSSNKLTNGGAESGLTGWTTSGVSAVAGGTAGSYCFRLNTTANMLQEVNAAGTQPPDYKISFDFLPEYEIEGETEVQAWVKVEHVYADGTVDAFTLPCRADVTGV